MSLVAEKKFEPPLKVQKRGTVSISINASNGSDSCSGSSCRVSTPRSSVQANPIDSQRIDWGASSSEPSFDGSKGGSWKLPEFESHATGSDISVTCLHTSGEDFYTKRRRLLSRPCKFVPVGRPPDG